jgi:hypothetical protein
MKKVITALLAGMLLGAIIACAQSQQKVRKSGTIVVVPKPLVVTTPEKLPDCIIGEKYEFQLVASGGIPPYTWIVAEGALPAGLTLSSTGLISGVCEGYAEYAFNYEATDSGEVQ